MKKKKKKKKSEETEKSKKSKSDPDFLDLVDKEGSIKDEDGEEGDFPEIHIGPKMSKSKRNALVLAIRAKAK